MINCEMSNCIYNDTKNRKCTLVQICLDQSGSCQTCLTPTIPQKLIEKLKATLVKKLASKNK